MAGYYAVVSQCDDAIGLILNELDQSGMAEDTIVVYTSDHGDAAGSHRIMDKHYVMYEEEVRVPMLIRLPGTPRCISEVWTSHFLDLGPTILDILGLKIPKQMQGVSLVPEIEAAMRGNSFAKEGTASNRSQIFSEYNGQQFGLYTQRMIRDDRFKYVWNPTDVDEFYNLIDDP